MNSCLYQCEVVHQRLSPRQHRFGYRIFMFYLDLDELDRIRKKLFFFGHNRFNWFNFRDRDHLKWPRTTSNSKTVKQNVIAYLASCGIDLQGGRVMLLTNVATLGYSFNPISFYFCYDSYGAPVCSVAEVCNTHGEMKLYLLDGSSLNDSVFRKSMPKLFYVSPFADLESSFDFIFEIPGESMKMRVDDYQQGKRFLLSSLTGTRRALSDANLFWYGVRFPLITLKIIGLIYWQAVVLKWKKIPFHRKDFNLHLQQDTYRYKKA